MAPPCRLPRRCTGPGGASGLTLETLGVTDDPYLGDPTAPIKVVAFEAPACSACRGFHTRVFPQIEADYIDTGRVVFYHQQWSIGEGYDDRASLALECVWQVGGNDPYWAFLDRVYSSDYPYYRGMTTDELRSELRVLADGHGLDGDRLVACYDGAETADEVNADRQAGYDAGGRASPTFFVLGPGGVERVDGAWGLEDAIEAVA